MFALRHQDIIIERPSACVLYIIIILSDRKQKTEKASARLYLYLQVPSPMRHIIILPIRAHSSCAPCYSTCYGIIPILYWYRYRTSLHSTVHGASTYAAHPSPRAKSPRARLSTAEYSVHYHRPKFATKCFCPGSTAL